MASTYKRGQIWWIKYYVGGKAVQHSLRIKNGREAKKICDQYSAAEKVGLLNKRSSTPIGPFLQDLCEYWRRSRKAKGAANDISRLRQFFGPVCQALQYPPRTQKRFTDSPPTGPKRRDNKTGRPIAGALGYRIAPLTSCDDRHVGLGGSVELRPRYARGVLLQRGQFAAAQTETRT